MIVFVDVPQIDLVRLRKTPRHEHRRVSRRRSELDAGWVLEHAERRRRAKLSHDNQVSDLRLV